MTLALLAIACGVVGGVLTLREEARARDRKRRW